MHKLIGAALSLCLLSAGASSAATITVNAGGDLQAALNAAQPGDTILLQAGATFTGNFTFPVKSGASYITVRSSASDSQLPAAGVRMTPAYASLLPKIRGAADTAAIKIYNGAHHWRLQFVEIVGNALGRGDIVRVGTGSETTTAAQPHHIVFDRVYIHGDPKMGSKRGISMNGGDTVVQHSYISDIKLVGTETQALAGWNGTGPYLIENNYLSAAGVNIMFGGADPVIPNLVPSDITVRRNSFTKDLRWRTAAVAGPTGATASAGASGALAAGTYGYKVVAYVPCGNSVTCASAPSSEVKATVGASGSVTVAWKAVTGATSYRVYGRTAGSPNRYWTATTTTFTDTGTAGTAGTPSGTGSRYVVKNLFELKNARRVLLEGNRFEYSWAQDQKGYALNIKPWNNGAAPWTTVEDVMIRNNRFDHVGGGAVIVGRHRSGTTVLSKTLARLTIVNNLFTDVSARNWGGSGAFVVCGDGATDVTVDHNTVLHDGPVANGNGATNVRFAFTNNLLKHNTYGIYGDGKGAGLVSLDIYFVGADIRRNVMAGGVASKYPPDNFFPPAGEFLGHFVNAAAGDYRLGSWSPYRTAGTDGRDVGVDVDALNAALR